MATIRPVRIADEAEWRRLWTAYLNFYNSTVPEEVYATTFARVTGDDQSMPRALVAEGEAAGTLIGLAHHFIHPHAWRIEPVTYLQDLYVDDAARGMGIGRALIEGVYAAADAAGAPSVYWLTQDFNTDARLLYDRIGTVTPFIKYQR